MDTTYYTFQTRRVRVSGGADLLAFVPTTVTASASGPAGEVLDFDRCRRKLETQSAWKSLAKAVESVKIPASGCDEESASYQAAASSPVGKRAFVNRPPAARIDRAGSWLELCASVAVILTCMCAGWAFLALA